MGYAIKAEVQLETDVCQGCGTVYAVSAGLMRRYNEEGASLRCPNPHCAWPSFKRSESEVDKLRKEVERATEARRWAEQAAERERKSHAATRGHLTRTKKRVAHGVCPCCNRTFQNVQRHMKTKHPEYVEGEP